MRRVDFIARAKAASGTRFHHQGRLPGVGLDCAGLVVCSAAACGYPVADLQGYAHVSTGSLFIEAIQAHSDLIDLAEALPGDLVVFKFQTTLHIAILTDIEPMTMIHAHAPSRKVVEVHLDKAWMDSFVGAYRLRGIE